MGGEKWWKYRYSRKKQHAKSSGREFSISLDEFIDIHKDWKCYYCNYEFAKKTCDYKRTIDRVNNNLGYVHDNCVLCCNKCNLFKKKLNPNTRTHKMFLKIYNKIYSDNK